MSSLLAFIHHLAAFTLVAALVIELVLIRETLTIANARKLLLADLVFGVSAGVVLIVGLLRVFYFEKGASYYFTNLPFLIKLALFALIGLLSIRPTRQFLAWRRAINGGMPPSASPDTLQKLRSVIHAELIAVIALILCAVLMARGIGSFG